MFWNTEMHCYRHLYSGTQTSISARSSHGIQRCSGAAWTQGCLSPNYLAAATGCLDSMVIVTAFGWDVEWGGQYGLLPWVLQLHWYGRVLCRNTK